MIPKEFDAITKEDIDALVINAISEGRTIEYKEQLPGGSDEEKRDFLAGAASFANAAGGDLIYGVRERRDAAGKATGVPEAALGLTGANADSEKRRLEDIIRAGIEPRIPAVRVRHLERFPNGPLLLMRIPKSWASPHMVTFRNLSRFYSRTSAGKHQLDVQEIRSAFNASQAVSDRIRNFHTDRLGKILADETPVHLRSGPRLIVHLIPLTLSDPSIQFDLSALFAAPHKIPPLRAYGHTHRINFDGLVTYTQSGNADAAHSYLQVFRSGSFEAVNGGLFTRVDGRPLIPILSVESAILEATGSYFAAAKEIGVSPPMLVLITFHGVRGYTFERSVSWYARFEFSPIDRDTLTLPSVLVEDFSAEPDILLKPVFDAVWQAVGIPGCEHYNAQGRWDGQRPKCPGAR